MWNPPDPDAFYAEVYDVVRQIPEGRVSTYGWVASLIPPPEGSDPEQYRRLGARWVGTALRSLGDPSVPWHRVINGQGKISLPVGSSSAQTQRRRLQAEGVAFGADDRVDLSQFGWPATDESD